MRKMKHRLSCLSVRGKLTLIAFIVIMISLISMAGITYIVSYSTLREQLSEQMEYASLQIMRRIDNALRNYTNIALTMAYDDRIHKIVGTSYRSDYEWNQQMVQLISFTNTISETYKDIKDVFIYDVLSKKKITKFGYGAISDDDWYYKQIPALLRQPNMGNPAFIVQSDRGIITVFVPIMSSPRERMGAVILNINIETIRSLYDADVYPYIGGLIIFDPEGNSISSVNINKSWESMLYTAVNEDTSNITLDGSKYIASKYISKLNGWEYVSIYSLDRLTSAIMKSLLNTLLIGAAIGAVILFLLTMMINRSFYKPLISIIGKIEKSVEVNADIGFIDRSDEIGIIYNRMSNIISLNNDLRKTNYENMLEAKDWELKSLQYQMNPHFLCNTLTDIVYMIRMNKKQEAEDMLKSLIPLYRENLNDEKRIIPLRDELQALMHYCAIVQKRHEDQYRISYDVKQEALGAGILKFTLQPIVENCIYHGMKSIDRFLDITIIAGILDSKLMIQVIDNGVGMTKNALTQLNENIAKNNDQSQPFSALSNINKRIRLFFGDDYKIQIESEPNMGTTVVLLLPLVNC